MNEKPAAKNTDLGEIPPPTTSKMGFDYATLVGVTEEDYDDGTDLIGMLPSANYSDDE